MAITDRKCLYFIAFSYFLTFILPSSHAENANICLAPPQPDNGSRKLLNLESFILSEVQEGTELPFESLLKYECKYGYKVLGSSISKCRSYGNWVNIPVCRACRLYGRNGQRNENDELSSTINFACHASLFIQKTADGSKDFICGATIIQENLLLTAAHCVYDKENQRAQNPNKYYVAAGNIYPEYDSDQHDQQLVQKSRVKNIHINEEYLGIQGNFTADIAILEIKTPFVFSNLLFPACLDVSSNYILLGKIIDFSHNDSVLSRNYVVHTVYIKIPFNQCKIFNNSIEFERYKTMDKFCAAPKSELGCSGIDGSGLIIQTKNGYFLEGIRSSPLSVLNTGSSETCGSRSYSLLTRISSYRAWIRDMILQIEISNLFSSSRDSTVTSTTSTTIASFIPHSQSTTTTSFPLITRPIVCKAPPQPRNGNRQLHESQCQSQNDCDVQEGVELPTGSYLTYKCYDGYEISGTHDVLCSLNGKWINIPVCIEIYCDSLVSASTFADCTYNDEWTSCESSVKPGTIAKLICRNGYKQDSTILSIQRDQVTCNDKGQWTPDPIKCIPVCGYVPTLYGTPFIVNGINAKFVPWHATLYETKRLNGPKEFICGATIITENFLVTAAHCVSDETINRVKDPRQFYVATGNTDRDYDYEQHDIRFVKKVRVKHIYVHCNYLGLSGNYAFDIALLQIEVPFVFTNMLVPACLDDTIIHSGLGVVAGFGFTASMSSSPRLQITKLPYVSATQCKAINNSVIYKQYVTSDKFCAGYTNGTSVCNGDSGGGLVFQAGGLWFLRGIVSIGISANLEADPSLYKYIPAFIMLAAFILFTLYYILRKCINKYWKN
ncbi:PREDICTED: uncharacterized protein LOC106790293 [Polistes canadensis]|uniref:uncharacterized protein LOC106790293 n=1 Tax=Polistes canadensis TaxID=91411 RepID=UPI000718F5BD|nr:PREDICTED: uncharacterized protein LOC106790293 [Polistes canadensis]